MVYEWLHVDGPNAVERLLGPDQSTSNLWTIRIHDPKANPTRRGIAELKDSLQKGEARVLATDPFAYLIRPEADIKRNHRAYRDKAWGLIAPLVEREDGGIFNFYSRNSPVAALAKRMECAPTTIYRKVRQYYQRGQTKNSQLPLFDQCGWRDRLEPKKIDQKQKEEDRSETKKLGRPSKLSAATGERLGVNITKEIDQLFRAGIRLFYERREKRNLTYAFHLTLEKFFNHGYYQDRNGVWVAALPPASELPSYRQFKYWYNKHRQPRRAQIARELTSSE